MRKNRKSVFYIAGGVIGLILILMAYKFISQGKYSGRIPDIPSSPALSEAVTQQITEIITEAKRNPTAAYLGKLGMVYHSSASYQQAEVCYKLAIERDPDNWMWSYYLGYLAMEMGQSEEVIEHFSRVIEIKPEIYHAWYYSGEAHMNLRSIEKAIECFERISGIPRSKPGGETSRIDHFPLGIYARFQLSMIYFNSGELELAEKTVRDILETDKLFGPAYRLLGNIYRARGDEATGDQYNARASGLMIVISPVDALIDQLVLLSRSELFVLKKVDEAINGVYSDWALRIIDNALQFLPENRYLLSKAIKTWLWFDISDKAIAHAESYLNIAENTYAELFEIGDLFYHKELYKQAIKYFTKLEEQKPGVMETREKLAISLWRIDEREHSLDILDQILDSNPHNMDVLADVADLMFFDLNESEASSYYLKIVKHFLPSDSRILKMSAWEAENQGETGEAIALYEASFKANPEDIVTINKLGELLVSQKMWGKSIRLYKEALNYHSNYPLFMERLGTLLITCPDPALKDINRGIEYSERAFTHIGSSPDLKIDSGTSLAKAYFENGDYGRSTSMINASIAIARRYFPDKLPELEEMAEQLKSEMEKSVQ